MTKQPSNFLARVFLGMAGISILAFSALFYVVLKQDKPDLPDEAFYKAAQYSDITILDSLYRRDPKILDRPDPKGVTALFYALENKQIAALRWLLQNGANFNQKDAQGRDAFAVAKNNNFAQGLEQLKAARATGSNSRHN